MPIAVPRSEVGANIDTNAGKIVSNAVNPVKNRTKPTPSRASETDQRAATSPATVNTIVSMIRDRGSPA